MRLMLTRPKFVTFAWNHTHYPNVLKDSHFSDNSDTEMLVQKNLLHNLPESIVLTPSLEMFKDGVAKLNALIYFMAL